MFPSLLVANRGEIACRIFRTARAMGIKCIAVYSEADARAKHVREADEAYPIGPAPAADSYLNIARVLEAAKKSGAAAIHPGYGFLSENPDFAEAVIKAGIVWVGPQPAAIRAMGLKDEAKRIAEEAGAPVVPGYRGADQSEAVLMSAAKEIGFPVLIKAVAGGGGRGIREVREAGEFSATLASAQREAKAAFGDDRVLVEKLIARPRHIEVQVFGDSHGNLVHLFERDCSLQRRRQKVIEEAPAPGMTDEARAAMTEAALKIARAVNYQNAGTVEFIVEGAPRPDNFYFMEMNTRLQVEHPVTEAITGVDLVEWQLRVAAGEELPLAQDDIEIHGHAIEARINAEDPAHEYRPSVGRISHCAWPRHAHSVHAGFERGDEVSPHYDSLIAKIVALSLDGETCDEARLGALATLKRAISAMEIVGIETNARFVQRCLGLSDFYWGNLHTSLIADHLEELVSAHRDDESAALLLSLEDITQPVHDPWGTRDGWRANAESRAAWRWTIHGRQLDVRLHAMNAGVSAVVSGETETVRHLGHDSTGQFFATPVFGFRQEARIERLDGLRRAFMGGGTFDAFPPGAQFDLDEASASDSILAPLPGKIAAVNAKPGDAVTRGDVLAVLEAMKMEHALTAPRAGVVEEVAVRVGAQVKQRDLIVRLAAQA